MPVRTQGLRKEQVLSALADARQRILAAASRLPVDQRDRAFLGVWSVKDLLAHLAGWDDTNLRAIEEVMAARVPSFYEHHDRDWQAYNAMLVKEYGRDSFEELVTLVMETHERLLRFLKTIPAESFDHDFGVRFRGYRVTVQRLLESEAKDERTHLQQIEQFARSLQDKDAPTSHPERLAH